MTSATIVADAHDTLVTLNRIVSLLRSRCFEILSFTAARSETAGVARVTIVVDTALTRPGRVVAYLAKLADVWNVKQLEDSAGTRELALVRIVCPAHVEPTLDTLADARVIERNECSAVIEIVAEPATIDDVLTGPLARVIGFVRSGALSLPPASTGADRSVSEVGVQPRDPSVET